MTRSVYDLDRDRLGSLLAGEPSYRVDQIWEGLYRSCRSPAELTNVPRALRSRLEERFPDRLELLAESVTDSGDTIKWLWTLHDGSTVETVLMRYPPKGSGPGRNTVCVSTQAGCAMGCSFCATGQAGFERHLGVGEIVEQVVRAQRHLGDQRLSNVVFMGMGEPLANPAGTWPALHRINRDMGIGARHLTVSTVGLVPGIRRLASEDLAVNLAVSLHAAHDELRNQLVPVNRRWPISELMDACADYSEATRRRITFEWALISEVNDGYEDADRLVPLARGLGAHVNLIPLNPTPGFAVRGSSRNRVHAFAGRLRSAGVNVTIRDTRGSDIDAACGQLRATYETTPVERPRRRSLTERGR